MASVYSPFCGEVKVCPRLASRVRISWFCLKMKSSISFSISQPSWKADKTVELSSVLLLLFLLFRCNFLLPHQQPCSMPIIAQWLEAWAMAGRHLSMESLPTEFPVEKFLWCLSLLSAFYVTPALEDVPQALVGRMQCFTQLSTTTLNIECWSSCASIFLHSTTVQFFISSLPRILIQSCYSLPLIF